MAKKNTAYTIEDGVIALTVSSAIYPAEAILNTTYFFIEEFYTFLVPEGTSTVRVELKPKARASKKQLEAAAGEFYNTLTAESLRLKLNESSRRFREEILERAIAAALSPPKPDEAAPDETESPLELDEELKRIIEKTKNVKYTDDPLGISVPVQEDEPVKAKKPAGKTKKPAAKSSKKKKKK